MSEEQAGGYEWIGVVAFAVLIFGTCAVAVNYGAVVAFSFFASVLTIGWGITVVVLLVKIIDRLPAAKEGPVATTEKKPVPGRREIEEFPEPDHPGVKLTPKLYRR